MAKSKTIIRGSRKFHYDRKNALLVCTTLDGEYITSTGLSEGSWDEDAEYWVDQFVMEMEEELSYLMEEFRQEFKG